MWQEKYTLHSATSTQTRTTNTYRRTYTLMHPCTHKLTNANVRSHGCACVHIYTYMHARTRANVIHTPTQKHAYKHARTHAHEPSNVHALTNARKHAFACLDCKYTRNWFGQRAERQVCMYDELDHASIVASQTIPLPFHACWQVRYK